MIAAPMAVKCRLQMAMVSSPAAASVAEVRERQ
jgi:hypothetical protein